MYERHFHLSSKPFALNPDPSFLYPSRQHANAITMLEFALESQAAFCLLTGRIGSGKTMVIRELMRSLGDKVSVGLISNSHQRFHSIIPWALSAFGITPRGDSEIVVYEALTDFVIGQYAKGRRSLLVLDEAQNLPVQVLEELRLISNINSGQDVALQVLLVGQPELRATLERPELVQFAQRVAVDYHLEALDLPEVQDYIQHRLSVAGGDPALFRADAVAFIHERSGGIPRLINLLCDMSLVYAFAEGLAFVEASLVRQVLQDRNRGRAMRLFGDDSGAVSVLPSVSQPVD